MVKKKMSGQTLAIIILGILLISAICFGGVYAFYSSTTNKISGTIVMANLNVELGSNGSGSQIQIYNNNNIVPNEELKNTPLKIYNKSIDSTYLVVLYEVKANKTNEFGVPEEVVDAFFNPVIDTSENNYIDPTKTGTNSPNHYSTDYIWTDYVFHTTDGGHPAKYRALVSTTIFPAYDPTVEFKGTEVIKDGRLKLHALTGNEFQSASITLTFQAFAIGADSLTQFINPIVNNADLTDMEKEAQKCQIILEKIQISNTFFSINY